MHRCSAACRRDPRDFMIASHRRGASDRYAIVSTAPTAAPSEREGVLLLRVPGPSRIRRSRTAAAIRRTAVAADSFSERRRVL